MKTHFFFAFFFYVISVIFFALKIFSQEILGVDHWLLIVNPNCWFLLAIIAFALAIKQLNRAANKLVFEGFDVLDDMLPKYVVFNTEDRTLLATYYDGRHYIIKSFNPISELDYNCYSEIEIKDNFFSELLQDPQYRGNLKIMKAQDVLDENGLPI